MLALRLFAFLALAAAAASSGCVSVNPAIHPAPLGPLRVEEDPARVKKLVTAMPAQDSGPFGGFSIVGDLGLDARPPTFLLLHKDKLVDEQDFYEIAGDTRSMDTVKRYRDLQEIFQYLGYYAAQFPAGFGCFGTTFATAWTGLAFFIFPPFALFGCVLCGGFAGVATAAELIGISLGNLGRSNLQRRNPILPIDVAKQAAATYNARRGFAVAAPSPPAVAERGPPASLVEVQDPTRCVDADAVRRDMEALVQDPARRNLRLRIEVEALPGNARHVHAALFSGADTTARLERELQVTEAECREVPRMLSRIVRAHVGGGTAQAH